MSENNLTHFDAAGNAVMVDVSGKPVTAREATARGILTMNAEAFAAVQSGTVKKAVEARCTVKTSGVTGVEMEALTGVSTALLTIYDMCKAVDKGMELSGIHLVEKTGGKSGHYIRSEGGYV